MNGTSGLPFACLPGLGEDELPGFSAEECPEELPDLSKHFSLAAEVLKADRSLYRQMRTKKTSGGVSFAKCIKTGMDNRGHPMIKAVGAVAGDAESYDTFQPFFDQVLALCHGEEVLAMQHGFCPARSVASALEPPAGIVVSCHLRASRNLKDVPFVPSMRRADRAEVERRIVSTLHAAYYPLAGSSSWAGKPHGMDPSEEKMLLGSGLLFREPDSPALLSTGGGRHWPEGRGVMVLSESPQRMWAWINEEEHFKLMVDRNDGNLKQSLMDATAVLRLLESTHGFAKTQRLGYLTSSPMNLGIAMVASYVLRLPNLMPAAKKELVDWCRSRDIIARGVLDPQGLRVDDLLEISHRQKIGIRAEDMVAELGQEAALLCRAENLVAKEGLGLQEALDLVKPRELTPTFSVHGEEAADVWAFSGDHLGMLISNAMILEEIEAVKVKLGQSLMAGTLGPELTDRAAAWQQEREEDFERQKAEAAVRIQAIQRGKAQRNKAAKTKQEVKQPTEEAIEARKALLREALETALNDGTLEQVLMDCNPMSPQDLRARARQCLSDAANSGRLEHVIKDKVAAKEELLRADIAQKLLLAAEDGTLEAVLAQGKQHQVQADLRKRVGAQLMAAAEDGSLEKTLSRQAAMKADELRLQIGLQLLTALEDGSLENALQEKAQLAEQQLRQRVQNQLVAAAADGRLEAALRKQEELQRGTQQASSKNSLDEIRQKAAQALTAASQDGSLEKVLGNKAKSKADQEVERIRMQAALTLSKAVEDGTLDAVLKAKASGKNQELSSVRQKAAQLLMTAANDGSLEAVLSKKAAKPVEDGEYLRQQAALLLQKAAEDGSLEALLKNTKVQEQEDLRQKTAKLLMTAADDGSLEDVLKKTSAASQAARAQDLRWQIGQQLMGAAEDGSLEKLLQEKAALAEQQLRQRVQDQLVAAAADGRLEVALRQQQDMALSLQRMESVRQQTAAKLLAAAEDGRLDRALGGGEQVDLEMVRQRLAQTLLASAEDGRLESALGSTSDMDVLRQRVSAQMLAAAEDGRLDEALHKHRQAKQDAVRSAAAASLLKAAEDGQLQRLLGGGATSLDDIRSRVAASIFEAAESDRLEEALRGNKSKETTRATNVSSVTTVVPWSDVVPDEIRSTELIAQAHLAANGQLQIGAQAAQSTLLRYERRIGHLMASIHQAEKDSLTKSAEAASLEVALQEAVMELRRVDQDLERQKLLIGNEELRALQLQDRQRQLMDQLDQETLKAKHARIEWRGLRELA